MENDKKIDAKIEQFISDVQDVEKFSVVNVYLPNGMVSIRTSKVKKIERVEKNVVIETDRWIYDFPIEEIVRLNWLLLDKVDGDWMRYYSLINSILHSSHDAIKKGKVKKLLIVMKDGKKMKMKLKKLTGYYDAPSNNPVLFLDGKPCFIDEGNVAVIRLI